MNDRGNQRKVATFRQFILVKVPSSEINTVCYFLFRESFLRHGNDIFKIKEHRRHNGITAQECNGIGSRSASNI